MSLRLKCLNRVRSWPLHSQAWVCDTCADLYAPLVILLPHLQHSRLLNARQVVRRSCWRSKTDASILQAHQLQYIGNSALMYIRRTLALSQQHGTCISRGYELSERRMANGATYSVYQVSISSLSTKLHPFTEELLSHELCERALPLSRCRSNMTLMSSQPDLPPDMRILMSSAVRDTALCCLSDGMRLGSRRCSRSTVWCCGMALAVNVKLSTHPTPTCPGQLADRLLATRRFPSTPRPRRRIPSSKWAPLPSARRWPSGMPAKHRYLVMEGLPARCRRHCAPRLASQSTHICCRLVIPESEQHAGALTCCCRGPSHKIHDPRTSLGCHVTSPDLVAARCCCPVSRSS